MFLADDAFSDHSSFEDYISVSPSAPPATALHEAIHENMQYPSQTDGEVVEGLNKNVEELSSNLYRLPVPFQGLSVVQPSLSSTSEGLSQPGFGEAEASRIDMPYQSTSFPYNTSFNYQAQMTPVFFDALGRPQHQAMNGIYFSNQYCLDAASQSYQNQAMGLLPLPTSSGSSQIISTQPQPFNPRYHASMFDPNLKLSASAPARMPMYAEQFSHLMAISTSPPVPVGGHSGYFRVSSAVPATNLEPASGPQRSNSARPVLETAPLRRRPSNLKEESSSSQPPVKPKTNGVAFPTYVDRVKLPEEWKDVYTCGKELPTGFSRPPYDYAGLIGRVLLEGTDVPKRMTVAELFYALINKYPFYMANPRLLYNGLRHNLTGCEALIKADRQWGDQASSRYWTIKPGSESCFRTGYFVKDSKKGPGRARKMVPFVEAGTFSAATTLPPSVAAPRGDGTETSFPEAAANAQSAQPDNVLKPSIKKGRSVSGIYENQNALALTGIHPTENSSRPPLSMKTNVGNNRRTKGAAFSIDVEEEYSKRQDGFKERGFKKTTEVKSKGMKPYPYHTTIPTAQGGLMFQPPGANIGPYMTTMPAMPQYTASSDNQPSIVLPMPPSSYSPLSNTTDSHGPTQLQVDPTLMSTQHSVSNLNSSGVSNITVAESNCGSSAMSSPSESCLASAMDFTLVRRRSQEELDADMQR